MVNRKSIVRCWLLGLLIGSAVAAGAAAARFVLAADCVVGCNQSTSSFTEKHGGAGTSCTVYVGNWCLSNPVKKVVTVDVGDACHTDQGGINDVQQFDCTNCSGACVADTTGNYEGSAVDTNDADNCTNTNNTFLRKSCQPAY